MRPHYYLRAASTATKALQTPCLRSHRAASKSRISVNSRLLSRRCYSERAWHRLGIELTARGLPSTPLGLSGSRARRGAERRGHESCPRGMTKSMNPATGRGDRAEPFSPASTTHAGEGIRSTERPIRAGTWPCGRELAAVQMRGGGKRPERRAASRDRWKVRRRARRSNFGGELSVSPACSTHTRGVQCVIASSLRAQAHDGRTCCVRARAI